MLLVFRKKNVSMYIFPDLLPTYVIIYHQENFTNLRIIKASAFPPLSPSRLKKMMAENFHKSLFWHLLKTFILYHISLKERRDQRWSQSTLNSQWTKIWKKLVLEWTVRCSRTVQFFVMFNMSRVKFGFGPKCDVQRCSKFGPVVMWPD